MVGPVLPRELIQRMLAYASKIPWLIERAPCPLYPRCLSVRVRVWLGEQLVLEHRIGGRDARWMRIEGPRSEDGRRMTLRRSVMRDGVDLWVGEVYDDAAYDTLDALQRLPLARGVCADGA